MTDYLDIADRALTALPPMWRGLRSMALQPPRSSSPAGASSPGPRIPIALGYFDQAEELHALVASWAMAVGEVISASPPLHQVRCVGDRPIDGYDPSALCTWLRSALPEVERQFFMGDLARELSCAVSRGTVAINGREVTAGDRAAARLQLDAWLERVKARDA